MDRPWGGGLVQALLSHGALSDFGPQIERDQMSLEKTRRS